jgi:tetratricopeptide (TPR) repeat protein
LTSNRDENSKEILKRSEKENEKVKAKSEIFERFCKFLNGNIGVENTESNNEIKIKILDNSEKENEKIQAKSRLFARYCKFPIAIFCKFLIVIFYKCLNMLEKTRKDGKIGSKSTTIDFYGIQTEIIREVIKEKFAIWLKTSEAEIVNVAESLELYKSFENEIRQTKPGEMMTNPYYYVHSGNKFLNNDNFVTAIKMYTKAIELEPNYEPFAYLNRAAAYHETYKVEIAINALETAKKLLQRLLSFSSHFQEYCQQNLLTEPRLKFERKSLLLNHTLECLENVQKQLTKSISRKKSLKMWQNNEEEEESVLIFTNWKELQLQKSHESYKREAVELKKNGWFGLPVLKVYKTSGFIGYFKFFQPHKSEIYSNSRIRGNQTCANYIKDIK